MLLSISALCTISYEGEARAQYPYGPAQAPAPPLQQTQRPAQSPYGQYYGGPQPMQTQPQPSAGSSRRDDDSGRELEFFYARAGVGGALIAPGALSDNANLGNGIGGAFELALGVRLLVFTLGPRARLMPLYPDKTLWQLGAEAAFHIPLGRFEPFVGLQGGYTFGSSNTQYRCAQTCPSSLSVGGADVGLGGGADYYLTPQLSVGAAANFMFLFLSRKALDAPAESAFASSASMTGLGVTLGLHAAFHL